MVSYNFSAATLSEVQNLPQTFWTIVTLGQLQQLFDRKETQNFMTTIPRGFLDHFRGKMVGLKVNDSDALDRVPLKLVRYLNVGRAIENVQVSNEYFCFLFGLDKSCLSRHSATFSRNLVRQLTISLDLPLGIERVIQVYKLLARFVHQYGSSRAPTSLVERLGSLKEIVDKNVVSTVDVIASKPAPRLTRISSRRPIRTVLVGAADVQGARVLAEVEQPETLETYEIPYFRSVDVTVDPNDVRQARQSRLRRQHAPYRREEIYEVSYSNSDGEEVDDVYEEREVLEKARGDPLVVDSGSVARPRSRFDASRMRRVTKSGSNKHDDDDYW